MGNKFTISTYPQLPDGWTSQKATIISSFTNKITRVQVGSTSYLPISANLISYNFTSKVLAGQMFKSDLSLKIGKIGLIRANLTISNISFWDDIPLISQGYIFAGFGQTQLTVDSCSFKKWNTVIFYVVETTVLVIRNSLMDADNCIQGIIVRNLNVGNCNCPTCLSSFLFENNIIYGDQSNRMETFLQYAGFGPFIIRNNTFINFQFKTVTFDAIAYYFTRLLCVTNAQDSVFIVESNTFTGSVSTQGELVFFASAKPPAGGNSLPLNVIFRNNSFVNISTMKTILTLSLSQASQLTIDSNYFENVTVQNPTQNWVVMSAPLGSVFMTNNRFNNTQMDQGFLFQTFTSTITNNTFNQIWSGSAQKAQAVLYFIANQKLIMSAQFITNCQFVNTNFIYIKSTPKFAIDGINFINSTIINRDYILVDNNMNGSIANVFAKNLSSYPTSFALVTFNIITSGSLTSLTNLTLLNSQVPLLNFNQILIKNTSPIEFKVFNISIKGSQLTSTQGFFNFGSFTFPLFSFNLNVLSISEVDVQNSVLYSNMIGTITIDQASVKKLNGILLYLSPFSSQSGIHFCVLNLTNSIVENNNALENSLMITQTNSKIQAINSTFSNNFGLGRGSVGFADKRSSEISSLNCTFDNNYAVNGGVFYSHMDSQISLDNSTFRNNFAVYGGVAYINDDGVINVKNSQFINNSALVGNVFYLINSLDMSYFSDVSYETNKFTYLYERQNFVMELQTLPLSDDLTSLFDESFLQKLKLNNQLSVIQSQEDILIYIQKFQVTVSSLNQFSNEERFIKSSAGSTIIFNSTIIRDTQLQYILESSFSVITLSNVLFTNITFPDDEIGTWLLDIQVGCSLTFNDSSIQQLNTPFLRIFQSSISFNNISFTNFENKFFKRPYLELDQVSGSIILMKLENFSSDYENFLEITSSEIEQTNLFIQNILNRYIYCMSSVINIKEATFANNRIQEEGNQIATGGLFMNSFQSLIRIGNSSFINNSGGKTLGGLVYNERSLISQLSTPLVLNQSIFRNNSAYSGAVLYNSDSNVEIDFCIFNENSAEMEGGVLLIQCQGDIQTICQSKIENTIFTSNSAGSQGGAINYDFLNPKLKNLTFLNNDSPYGSDIASYSSSLVSVKGIEQYQSGRFLDKDEFILTLVDQQGLRVLSADSIKLSIYSQNTNYSLLGPVNFFSSYGVYDLQNLAFKGLPGTNGTFYFNSEGIDRQKYLKVFGTEYQDLSYTVSFRDCQIGEILRDSQCIECAPGSYSLLPKAYSCQVCVDNAICPGGSVINLDQGMWRANTSTDILHICIIKQACPGGVNMTCAEGYTGILCHECVGESQNGNYYARSGENKCGKCTHIYFEYLKLLAVVLFLLLYVFIMVAMIIRNPSRKKDSSVLLRILTNYFQILTMIQSLNLNWPQQIIDFLNKFTFLSSATSNFFNVGCLLQTQLTQKLNYFAIESIIFSILPFLFMLFSIGLWKLLSIIRPSTFKRNHRRNIYVTIFVFIFLVYPSITKNCFQMFTCLEIDGVSRLSRDLNIVCWESDHKFMIFAIALPIAAVWIFGFPLAIFILLFRNRNKLDDQDFLIKYGLFYIGLNDKQYYWEVVVINARKVVFTGISVAMTKEYRYKLVLVCVLLLIINQSLAKYLEPYNNSSLNSIEQNSIYVCVLSMLMGMFFLETSKGNEQDALLGIFIVLVFINSAFLFHWFILMLRQIIKTAKQIAAPIKRFSRQMTSKKSRSIEITKMGSQMIEEEVKEESNDVQKLQLGRLEDEITQLPKLDKSEIDDTSPHKRKNPGERKFKKGPNKKGAQSMVEEEKQPTTPIIEAKYRKRVDRGVKSVEEMKIGDNENVRIFIECQVKKKENNRMKKIKKEFGNNSKCEFQS